ncbi:MAG: MBL fold metallo-hydrolase [bacterium]|nr:MBL fold metallo-hydrolase [bacterium]
MLSTGSVAVLRPLWFWATGVGLGIIGSWFVTSPGAPWVHTLLVFFGVAATVVAVSRRWKAIGIFLAAGLALGAGRGLTTQSRLQDLGELAAGQSSNIRIEATLRDGWSDSRWGARSEVIIRSANRREISVDLPRRCRIEVRGDPRISELPSPGTRFSSLARLRGTPDLPLLVISSSRLLHLEGSPGGLPMIRQTLVEKLFQAAGTNVSRIRSAELACALSLGRRNELPQSRVDQWRRSGLGHMLAVSGLHVGLVAGLLWLTLTALGTSPKATRLAMMVAVPAYAAVAGASPSALRAAIMIMIYLGARLLGRTLLPLAAILLAGTGMLLADPTLIANVGFQLTVLVTAAIIRWAPALANLIPGPRRLGLAITVPIVAQLAAAPMAALHFRRVIPLAAIANILGPFCLTPALLLSLAAAFVALLSPSAAAVLLDGVTVLRHLFIMLGSIGGSLESVVATPSPFVIASLVLFGWLALQSRRLGQVGGILWFATTVFITTTGYLPRPAIDQISLVPVSDGLSAYISSTETSLLFDTGSSPRQVVELLTDIGTRKIDTLVLSHLDSDHIGGAIEVISRFRPRTLIVPQWALGDSTGVPLLRVARAAGVRLVPAVSGLATSLDASGTRLEFLWPPMDSGFGSGNECSLVARVLLSGSSLVLSGDIDARIESRILTRSDVACDILVVAHHGSRNSSSPAFLTAARPQLALIPAGERNLHHHPSPVVLQRLDDLDIAYRYPARDGWCGAQRDPGGWRVFP